MSYRIAGIDVHKKVLAVVIADVEVEGEYQFARRLFSSSPDNLRLLAEWLIQQEVEEAVMGINSAILETAVGSTGAVLEADLREAEKRLPGVGNVTSGAGTVQSWTTGPEEGFPGRRTTGEAASGK